MRLRFLFFMIWAGIAVLPVIALASWIFVDARDREIESVCDKHLVIAKNIGEALERYAVDLKNGFELVAAMPADVRETPAVSNFPESLDLLYFCVVDRKTGVIRSSVHNKPVPLSAGRVAPDRFHQFFSLLDGDGVDFSPVMIDESGRPALFLLRATAAGQIEIEVSDKGAGMPSDEIREVLEPLSQGNRNKARKYEGSGLGLHICSKFMQLHGGTLEIESAVGEGTSATLCFPVERSL